MRVLSSFLRLSAVCVIVLSLSEGLGTGAANAGQSSPPVSTPAASCTPLCPPNTTTGVTPIREDSDLAAALESIQYALSTIGDGGTYIWRRRQSPLSGVVQPVSSFRNSDGRICRLVALLLSQGKKSAKSEGVACRLENGQWNLEG